MRKRLLFLSIFSFIIMETVFGQQDPQYTQYMYNMNIVNPAYAGSRETLTLNFLGRTQWVGLDGSPNTITFSIHSPLRNERLGLGFSAIYDEIGPVQETNMYGDFSYTLRFSSNRNLALGVKAGVTFQDLSLGMLTTAQANDPLFVNDFNETYPNFGVGAFYYTDKFYLGLSMPNFLESRHFEDTNGVVSNASEKMHFFGTFGYVFNLSENTKLKPSSMVKAAIGAPVSIDFSANLLFNEKFEVGISYRLDDSVSGILGFNINSDFRIGYAYDYTLSNLGDYNSGSHELMLLYDFNSKKFNSPRFF